MRLALAALAAVTLLRLGVGARAPLSPDEAYYWIWSRALAPGYLDHPPMVALWIRAGTALLGDTALGVRLLGPLAGALGTLLLIGAGRDLLGSWRAGMVAALLLNATLFFAVGSVTMTPDTALLLFWTACLACLARLLRTDRGVWWLPIGLCAGLACASKYTGAFLPLGILLWLLIAPAVRPWLRRGWTWAGVALGALSFAPVLAWNAAHDWVGLAKQGGRTEAWQPERALQFLGEFVGGQIGLATPLVFLLCAAGMAVAVRRWRDPAFALLAVLSVVPMLVFLQHALGDRVQGNWPAIVYPAASLAAAALVAPAWRRMLAPAVALGAVMSLAVYGQATFAPIDLPFRADPTLLRLAGWDTMAQQVAAARSAAHADFIAADGYGPASELAWYLPPGDALVGVERRWGLFDLPDADQAIAGRSGILVRSARRGEDVDTRPWSSITEIGRIARGRRGLTAEEFRLYRVVGRASDAATVLLPRPNLER
jgi:4-amino-4-deoxy-L-arabinose transferase-like glycosyltransferase